MAETGVVTKSFGFSDHCLSVADRGFPLPEYGIIIASSLLRLDQVRNKSERALRTHRRGPTSSLNFLPLNLGQNLDK